MNDSHAYFDHFDKSYIRPLYHELLGCLALLVTLTILTLIKIIHKEVLRRLNLSNGSTPSSVNELSNLRAANIVVRSRQHV